MPLHFLVILQLNRHFNWQSSLQYNPPLPSRVIITMNKGLLSSTRLDLYNLAAGEVTLGSALMMCNGLKAEEAGTIHFPTLIFPTQIQKSTRLAFETIHALIEFPILK